MEVVPIMKLRSLIVAGAALTAMAIPSSALASSTSTNNVQAIVVSGELSLTPTVSVPMILGRGVGASPGVTSLAAASTNATFGVTAAVNSANTDGVMHQCDDGGTYTTSGKTLANQLKYNLGTIGAATPSTFAGAARQVVPTGTVGAAVQLITWTQSLADADNILATEFYCFKVDYTIT